MASSGPTVHLAEGVAADRVFSDVCVVKDSELLSEGPGEMRLRAVWHFSRPQSLSQRTPKYEDPLLSPYGFPCSRVIPARCGLFLMATIPSSTSACRWPRWPWSRLPPTLRPFS